MARRSPEMPTTSVLIVEDEALVAMFLVDLVEELGWAVVGPAANRDAALRAAVVDPPAIALVDFHLGGAENGLGVAKELQEAHGTAIIFLSGRGDLRTDRAVRDVNPVAVLQKPCQPNDLAAALRAAAA